MYWYPSYSQLLCHSFCEGQQPPHLNSLGSIMPLWLPLNAMSLLRMHIIPSFAITTRYQCDDMMTKRVTYLMVWCESDGLQVVLYVHLSHRHDRTYPSLFCQVRYHSYIWGVMYSWAWSQITIINAGHPSRF